MSPAIEKGENLLFHIGKDIRDTDLYVVSINLETPGKLTPERFDEGIQAIIATEKLSFPYSAITEHKRFKWIGYRNKLMLFNDGYEHWNVNELLLKGNLVQTPPQGAGHLDYIPPKICFWGSSQTLVRDGLDPKQSNKFKLEILPKLLGEDCFSFE